MDRNRSTQNGYGCTGSPDVLITDNGSQFGAKLFRKMADNWEIELRYTAPYSPQCNPVERQNRVIKTLIAQSVREDHRTWDEHLGEICFAINTAKHDSTLASPAMLCYGRELRVPKSISGPAFITNLAEEHRQAEAIHDERMQQFSKLYRKTQQNLRIAFARQSKYYNLRRRDVTYQSGDRVLKRTHVLSSAVEQIASKLAPKYEGPFEVINKKGYNVYKIRKLGSNQTEIAHVKDLKPFCSRL